MNDRTKILLVTDTHGELDIINALIEREGASVCVHCGDFGFYDDRSIARLSDRELRLRLKHSALPKAVTRSAFRLSPTALRESVREHRLLDGFTPYLQGTKRFAAPVYAVSGNHEDPTVVCALREQRYQVSNLTLLDDTAVAMIPLGPGEDAAQVRIVGLGGNWYLSCDEPETMFAPSYTGQGGQVRSSWLQFARILERELSFQRSSATAGSTHPLTLFASHVSPGKARILERMAMRIGADVVISGHMGPPLSQTWSLFSICEPHEVLARSKDELLALRDAWTSGGREACSERDGALVQRSFEHLDMPDFSHHQRRGKRADRGTPELQYRRTQFINLGDAPRHWSVLEVSADGALVSVRHESWLGLRDELMRDVRTRRPREPVPAGGVH